ncbi:MAG: DUF4349 domain-containing protein [Clostridiaceae bacterium]|jgi:hypothetical protein|nr:DUF4349 domain-containing protein [Clostridiaceae bacterium]
MTKKLVGLLLVLALIAAVMAGCGSSEKSADMPQTSSSGADRSDAGGFKGEAAHAEAPPAYEADSLAGGGSSTVDVSNVILAERKIIRSANLTIEVENFDNAFANIEGIIANIGFVQQTNINTERVYIEEELKLVKRGTIVLRVNKEMFDSVINKLRGLGDVYNYTTDGQDVTEQVFDVESRLRLLKMQQEKLEAYVEKLDDIEEIFKAESKLTDIRYQIESLTGNLNKLNSLVDLSTITINLNEKYPGKEPMPETYGDKLLNSLKESLLNVVEFLGDLLLFIVAALPILIFIGLCVLFGMWIYKKTIKKNRNKSAYMSGPSYPGGPAGYPAPTQPAPPAQGAAPAPQEPAKAQQGTAPVPEKAKQAEDQDKKQ